MRRFDLLAADAFAYEWPRRDPPSSLRRPGSPSLCSMVDHLTSLLYVLLPWNWKTESEDSQHFRRIPRSADILRLEQVRGNRRQNRVRTRLFAGGRWIRTIGPWRHAVGPVMENVDNLAEPAGRLSQSTTLRGCYVPGSRKREHGLASFVSLWAKPSWRRATARRFFSFGAGPMVRIRLPPPVSQAKLHSDRTRPEPIASFPGTPRSLPTAHSCCTSTMPPSERRRGARR